MDAIELSEADDARTAVLAAGQSVVLTLPENPGTGYCWEVPAGVQVLANHFEPPIDGAAGGGGRRVFTLAATSSGDFDFKLLRSWGAPTPARTFLLRVEVSSG